MASRRVLTWCVGLSLTAAVAACGGDTDTAEVQMDEPVTEMTETMPDETSTGMDSAVSVADIVGEPQTYLGREVTVEADLEEVLSPSSFRLDEDALLEGGVDNDLLVLSRDAAGLSHIDDQWLNNRVRVTGTVGGVNVTEIESSIGWDLDPEIEAELEGARAVLIADSVERVMQ
jgi:hypothetical protein